MIPRIFIVDDEAPARARLSTLLSDIVADCPHYLVGEAAHAQAALEGIAATAPDLVLLDVQMPGMSGLQLAEQLVSRADAAKAEAPLIIFVTAYDDYALNAFEVQAFDYLVKPVRAARLAQAIARASRLRKPSQPFVAPAADGATAAPRQHFAVQERGRMSLVPMGEVLYLKAELKYVTLRTKNKEYLIEDSLVSIEEELAAYFVRVHRNALVARNAIIGVERGIYVAEGEGDADKPQEVWQVILRDIDHRLPISRRQWAVIKALVR
ncbi:LytR/AlgR family response regulator transcription factor [Collimonas pratensis]|uniref:Response regulator n=1 Tax=Collimonas pratensis TaxID=279113 RepID=A0A127Q1T2_9BURK|nr:LytTR family DNA-binding domain-containing protein [Collimonas pratensis]AMP03993.1 response regulator [Collimonas pratensis]AMP13942.1 response regulator [Collimonas pratensis]NKI68543.1 response regulator [Collimonas pratensis]